MGEQHVDTHTHGRSPIISLETKEPVAVSEEACAAIGNADLIILGPGDLYTSTLANFAVSGLKECVQGSKATFAYIVNLFTKAGQTDGYRASEFIDSITRYTGRAPDAILMNTAPFPKEALDRYQEEGEFPVADDLGDNSSVVRGDFASAALVPQTEGDVLARSLIRHDPAKLAEVLRTLV